MLFVVHIYTIEKAIFSNTRFYILMSVDLNSRNFVLAETW